MALSKNNLETVSKLLVALTQRHDTVYNLVQKLNSGFIWRSPDGQMEIPLTTRECEELEGFINEYLQEADVIAATLRSHLGEPTPEPP